MLTHPIFDALAKQYFRRTNAIFNFQHAHPEPDAPIGDPDTIVNAFKHLGPESFANRKPPTYLYINGRGHVTTDDPGDSYGNALRDAASQYTPRYEYPEQPRDVPKYTVDYRYNAVDGRKRTIRLSDDEHAVLRVEPFWG